MKKSKIAIGAAIIVVAFVVAGCSAMTAQQENSEVSSVVVVQESGVFVDGKGGVFSREDMLTLERVLECEIGIIGEFIGESSSGFALSHAEHRVPSEWWGWTFSRLLVTEVLFGDVEVGDILMFASPYALTDYGTLLTRTTFTPMQEGDRWLFFVSRWDDAYDYFSVLNHELGMGAATDNTLYTTHLFRFPLPNAQLHSAAVQADNTRNSTGDEVFFDVDTATLGVYNRNDFNFDLYAEILDHFQIKPRDWVNPGRAFDERLIELATS
ncbi:MAG: hypothetical protein FWD35_01550 [Oscillospiraceae bacterium]|nr:hypothetical protein [Oscillospiraceae bacterium]